MGDENHSDGKKAEETPGCAMWNQVLLGMAVKEQGGGPHPPPPLITSFAPTPYPLPFGTGPPDLNHTVLPFLQFLVLPQSLEGLCVAIQGLEKGLSRLPSLGPAPRSQSGWNRCRKVRVPADLLDPQVPPESPCSSKGGTPGHQCCSHGFWVPSPGQGQGTSPKRQSLPCPAPLGCSASGARLRRLRARSPSASCALRARLSRVPPPGPGLPPRKSRCSSSCCRQLCPEPSARGGRQAPLPHAAAAGASG